MKFILTILIIKMMIIMKMMKKMTMTSRTLTIMMNIIPMNGQESLVPDAMQADTLNGFCIRLSLTHIVNCLVRNVFVAYRRFKLLELSFFK